MIWNYNTKNAFNITVYYLGGILPDGKNPLVIFYFRTILPPVTYITGEILIEVKICQLYFTQK